MPRSPHRLVRALFAQFSTGCWRLVGKKLGIDGVKSNCLEQERLASPYSHFKVSLFFGLSRLSAGLDICLTLSSFPQHKNHLLLAKHAINRQPIQENLCLQGKAEVFVKPYIGFVLSVQADPNGLLIMFNHADDFLHECFAMPLSLSILMHANHCEVIMPPMGNRCAGDAHVVVHKLK